MDRGKMIYTELNGIRDGKTCGVFYRYLHRRIWIAAYTYTAGTYDLNPGYSERIARAIAEAPIKNSYRGRILEYDSDYMALKGTL